jgi:hypothetical protein
VRTSAPGGSDWNCNVCAGDGFDFNQSDVEIDEHPASATPTIAAVVVVTNLLRDMDRLREAAERRAARLFSTPLYGGDQASKYECDSNNSRLIPSLRIG